MADDSKLVAGLKDGLDLTKQLNKEMEGVANNAERTSNTISGMKTGGSAGNFQGGNQRSSNAPSASSYPGMGSPGGYSGMGDPNNPYPGMNDVPTPKFRTKETIKDIGSALGGAFVDVAKSALAALPSPNEALYTSLMGERLRFYGARGVTGESVGGLYGQTGSYNLQRAMSTMGTPTSALDAVYAANSGAGMGLLPGLNNFSKGLAGYGGILGGAALASNLNPGLGLVGGMGVMGAMNQARRVNMLKMIGVSVRDIGSAEMNNLPDIIGKLYRILKNANGGKDPSANDIAVSAQSGNALDSILNQYFDDPNLRQTVISGLMQMANTKGQSLSYSGRAANLMATGGTTTAVGALAQTDTSELRMIQQYTNATTKGLVRGGEALKGIYNALGDFSNNSLLGTQAQNLASTLSFGETIAGARGGAGQLLLSGIMELVGKIPYGTALATAGAAFGSTNYWNGTIDRTTYTPNYGGNYVRSQGTNIFNINSPTDAGSIASAMSNAVNMSLRFNSAKF